MVMDSPPLMPNSEEAEVAVLGAILLGSNEALDHCLTRLSSPHFWQRRHQTIFRCIEGMARVGKPLDAVTVIGELKQLGKLEESGGDSYLMDIAGRVGTSAHVNYFAGIVAEKYKARRMIEICGQATRRAYAGEDAMTELERELFRLNSETSSDENQLAQGVSEFKDEIALRENGAAALIGLDVSLQAWKKAFGGILPARYYVIGGRPGAGKSALVEQLSLEVLLSGKRVLYVSREMTRNRVVGRIAAKLASVNYSKFLHGHSSREERASLLSAAERIAKLNCFLQTPSHMTGAKLRGLMRRAHRREAVDLVVVDYMQKLDRESGADMVQGVARNSEEISAGVIETGIPALLAVQLNREKEKENRRPRMSDIKESGQIEQDADCIALLWADKKKAEEPGAMRESVMTIAKNRDGACDIDEELWFNGPTMEFKDRITT